MATQYSPKSVTDGLVLCLDAANLKSYRSGSNTWTNLSGNNVAASFNNPGSSSFSNGAIVFTPSSSILNSPIGSFYSITDSRISSLTTELTLETWVNPTELGITVRPVSPRITETSQPLGFALGVNTIHAEINTSTGWNTTGTSNTNIQTNRWIHIMQTTSDSIKSFKTYVNGVLVRDTTFTGTPNSGGGLLIGRGFYGGLYNYSGSIAIVKYYNRALTPDEVLQNFSATRARFGV